LLIPEKKNDYSIGLENWEKLSIIGFWEKISSKIISGVIDSMSENWICSKSIDLWNIIINKDLENKSRKDVFDMLTLKLSDIIEENTKWWHIPVLSGYIWSFPEWIEERIGRWYSDATAAISAVWLARKWYGVVIEIQKSVKWLMSADPRILDNPENAKIIKKLNYLTAREITWDGWAQAKLLHPQALRSEVQEAWIKIHLFDPFSWESGSWIVNENREKSEKCNWITFIWWRKNVIFFSISSGKMFEKSILSRLFNIVKDYFSVDIVSSSETEVSFTIDWNWKCDKKLEEMTEKIKKEFNLLDSSTSEFVEYKKDRALIFCVWEHMKNYIWLMGKAITVLSENNINLKIVSQWRLQRAMIFWIEEKDLNKAINLLHNEFIKWEKKIQ
jgi:aspartokinase/homoserine dehydrogenase 1